MLKKIIAFIMKQNNFRFIALGFILVICLGGLFLKIPGAVRSGINLKYIDAFFTSASSVCVTGLATVDIFDTFTIYGQIIIIILIQIGGLGVTTLGAGIVLAFRRHFTLKQQNILKETLNLADAKDLFYLFKRIFIYYFTIEMIGFFFCLIFFLRKDVQSFYGYNNRHAFWLSAFHSISAFNNAGFDIIGSFKGFTNGPLTNDASFNIITAMLIVLGGLGFLVLSDIIHNVRHIKLVSLHTKIVCFMTVSLIIVGTLLVMLTERRRIESSEFSLAGAFFISVSSRTAGFSTYSLSEFTKAGQFIVILLMFIGASPGSTGGGIKTTTFFVLILAIRGMVLHKRSNAFKYEIPKETEKKAMVIAFMAIGLIILGSVVMCIVVDSKIDNLDFMKIIFEATSALGTVGLTLGITPYLSLANKILIIILMYIGRIGPLTAASALGPSEHNSFRYAEGSVPIG